MFSRTKLILTLGWTGSALATATYVSLIDQIRLNLDGHPGSIVLPAVAAVSCSVWVSYAFLKSPRGWPLVVCNIPGVVFGIITVITAPLAAQ